MKSSRVMPGGSSGGMDAIEIEIIMSIVLMVMVTVVCVCVCVCVCVRVCALGIDFTMRCGNLGKAPNTRKTPN